MGRSPTPRELGYRVKEVLFGVDTEAVGRTNQITGRSLIEAGPVTGGEFVVDVASITSDEGRRDGQFRGRIMSTDEFPEAMFTLTEPIELGTEARRGSHGVDRGDRRTDAARGHQPGDVRRERGWRTERSACSATSRSCSPTTTSPNPSTGGITTEDNGLLEFVLVFEPA